MDVKTLIERMLAAQNFARVINNPMAQFGTVQRPLLGASILPERNVPQNEFVEQAIRYRTMVANDGTRYSPVQKKRGMLTGQMIVMLGHSDIGSEFTASDYDAFIELIQRANPSGGDAATMDAIARLTAWADVTLRRPLDVKNEVQRWQAIVDASVVRKGDGGFRETVAFSNPSGHRVNAAGVWSSDAYDPYDDILAGVAKLESKGYQVGRIITSHTVVGHLLGNAKMQARVGKIQVAAGAVVGSVGRLSLAGLQGILSDDGIPPIEKYDEQYQTQTGSYRYLTENCMVILARTGRDATMTSPDGNPLVLQDTLGYVGIGRAAGQSSPGRAIVVTPFENKPPRIEGEAWQTSFPVILDPEAIYVIKSIS